MFCILKGPEHTFEFVNEAHIKALGFDATGLKVREAQPESVEVHGILDNVYATGMTAHLHEIAVTLGDSQRYFDLTYAARRDYTGTINGIMVLGAEVTKRVLADRAIQQAKDDLYRVLMQAPGAVAFLKGPELVYELANEKYLELVGKGSVILNKPLKVAIPELEQEVYDQLFSVYKNGTPYNAKEELVTVGNPRFFSYSVEQVKDHLGRPEGIIIFVLDVSDFVSAQKKTEESEAKFKTITEVMPQMVWSTLPDGYHDYYNNQWYEYTGVPVGSTDGEGWNNIFHPDDQANAWKKWMHSLVTGEVYEIEYRLRHHSGNYRWVLGRANPVKDKNGKIIRWMGTCTDIHDQKIQQEELASAVRARDEFLSIASHELKTPLTTIYLQSQIFSKSIEKDQSLENVLKRGKALADSTSRNSAKLNRLVDDMLDIARINTGKLKIVPEELDLCDLVHEVIDRMKPQTLTEINFDQCSGAIGMWDKLRIEQVIINLLSNAVRYGKNAPINVRVKNDSDTVTLEVKDSGLGISPENIDKIFERFERGDAESREVSGLGLGLHITKQIILQHEGTITVESEPGRGSLFRVSLPKYPGRK